MIGAFWIRVRVSCVYIAPYLHLKAALSLWRDRLIDKKWQCWCFINFFCSFTYQLILIFQPEGRGLLALLAPPVFQINMRDWETSSKLHKPVKKIDGVCHVPFALCPRENNGPRSLTQQLLFTLIWWRCERLISFLNKLRNSQTRLE